MKELKWNKGINRLTLLEAGFRNGKMFEPKQHYLDDVHPASVEHSLIDTLLQTTSFTELKVSEARVRAIVREELLEFKLQYLRDDSLFQRILREIRRDKIARDTRK